MGGRDNKKKPGKVIEFENIIFLGGMQMHI